jgi:hypothetical protein
MNSLLHSLLDNQARMDRQLDLLQGTLDMLILKAISLGPLHGYGDLLRIEQIPKGAVGDSRGLFVYRALQV